MDPIIGLNQIAQILRQKLSERSSSPAKDTGSPTVASSVAGRTFNKASAEAIKRKIGERIKALSQEDKAGKKAAQIFVEMVLLWEFGDQLIQDSQFPEFTREIVTTLAENQQTWHKLQTLLGELSRYSES